MIDHFCRVTMLGRATADPVTRAAKWNKTVTSFGFVVNERVKVGDEWRDSPMFIDCEAFGELAERAAKLVRKGYLVLVEGKLRLDEWVDSAKVKRRQHVVTLFGVKVMHRPKPPKEPAEIPAQKSEPVESKPLTLDGEPEVI
jgi:single-strand DNA-binding protein